MNKIFNKLWPFLLGGAIMVLAIVFGPQILKQQQNQQHTSITATPETGTQPTQTSTNERVIPLPGGLQPIVKKQTPEAIYILIAGRLIDKLKPDALLLTFNEKVDLNSRISQDLQVQMGLSIPPNYLVPKGIPDDWLKNPVFTSIENCQYQWDLFRANEKFINGIVDQLINTYSSKTIAVLGQEFAKVPARRKPGTEETAGFIKDLYGPDFIDRYYLAHIPRTSKTPKEIPPLSPRLKHEAEAEISSFWATEFSPEDLEQLKGYIAANGLSVKLMEDLQNSNLSEAEHGLMETTILGYRLNILHTVTCTLVSAYTSRGSLSNR
jgi:hypothetical protein